MDILECCINKLKFVQNLNRQFRRDCKSYKYQLIFIEKRIIETFKVQKIHGMNRTQVYN